MIPVTSASAPTRPNLTMGILVFARYDSRRLPGKALRLLGGMPLLERVIRRAQLLELPVYLATTVRPSDDKLVALADGLGVQTYRGSAERVLDRAVLAAEAFDLDVFVRLCGDRPLFPIDDLRRAVELVGARVAAEGSPPDLVTTYRPGITPKGLTTELVRTAALRNLMDGAVPDEHQEHVTSFFYAHRDLFRIVDTAGAVGGFSCPGFAVDTEEDLRDLQRVFAVSGAVDMSPAFADRAYAG